jgi:phosphate transport system substrate-binding protein
MSKDNINSSNMKVTSRRILTMAMGALSIIPVLMMLDSAKTFSQELKGTVKIDGSSTVFPITEAVSEDFQKLHKGVKITVGMSGTGGGFKKFISGEIDITNASRPMKEEELKKAQEKKIEFMELPVAYDGLTVVVNPKNEFVKSMTRDQLKKLWEPGSKIKTWKDLDPSWPEKTIKLYGPGADSGTFDFFTETVVGKAKASRADYTSSEDDNVLVNGVAGDINALGYFGYAYYIENSSKLKSVPIDGQKGKGPIGPTEASILNHEYDLSRPLFIVVSKKSADRPEVDAYVSYYLMNGAELAKAVGYVPLPKDISEKVNKAYKERAVGSWKHESK